MATAKLPGTVLMLLLLSTAAAHAQINRYMVFFTDKAASEFTISQPEAFLSEKAITRRLNQGIDITEQDIPVNENYVAGVRNTGAEVYFRSRWFNGVLVQCDVSLIDDIEALDFVAGVEFVAPLDRLINSSGRTKFNLKRKGTQSGSETKNQLDMLGITQMHQAGYRGEGMTIAVLDAGFAGVNTASAFTHLFDEQRVNLEVSQDFISNTNNVFQYDEHGTEVLSVIAGNIPEVFTGGAYKANFQLYVTEDANDEHRIEEYNWTFAAERADSAGADIISSSLGYYDFDITSMNYSKEQMDGQTAVVTRAAQWAADRGIVVVCSAGNEGNISSWRIITAPADAKDVLAVASVDLNGNRASSSSIGPSADGRIKPDIAARGVAVRVITPSGTVGSATGTSLAAPLITSLVAGVWQTFPELTNLEVMDLIKSSGSQASNPDNLLGYGIPRYMVLVAVGEQKHQKNFFEVFPNPTSDTILISPKYPDSVQSCTIDVINAHGQIVSSGLHIFNASRKVYQGSLRSMPAGLYFLRVINGGRKYVFKIVKE